MFTTWHESVKALNMKHDPRVCVCADDEQPPFNYVQIEGQTELSSNPDELKHWAMRLAGKYTRRDRAKSYGERNSVEGELLVKVTPTRIRGEKDVAGR